MKIAKYFWDLNDQALQEAENALKNPTHSQFLPRMVALLSRLDKPKELFVILPKTKFMEEWPRIRAYWIKRARQSEQRAWWETLHEQLLESAGAKSTDTKGSPAAVLKAFGDAVKERRIAKGLSQSQLARQTGLQQPVVSQIEDGRKNVTFFTLVRLCKVLGIEKLEIISAPRP